MPAMFASNELPPALTNGKGIPVTGRIAMDIPIFVNIWKNKYDTTPAATNLPYSSFADITIRIPLHNKYTNKNITTQAPIKPNSSQRTEKMKSLCRAGRKLSWVWVPSR
jgi:hypothetical protein